MEQVLEPRGGFVPSDLSGGETPSSGGLPAVSWPAIFSGAFVAASVSLILLSLGSGLGFAAISPWPSHGVSGTTFAVTAAIWLIIMQWISSAIGGYITGRLRIRWIGTHAHEVFFRDTAHGLVTWAVATMVVAATLATSVFSVLEGGVHAASSLGSAAAQGVSQGSAQSPGAIGGNYALDKLFRSEGPVLNGQGTGASAQGTDDPRMEAGHIALNAWSSGAVSESDRAYLTALVVRRTGLSSADAQKRVDEFVTDTLDMQAKTKAAADTARKAAAQAAIYTALAMLIGAFIASVSAALGGRVRDQHI